MLDSYTIGQAKRISPEAPVAVVHAQKQTHRPGGAGNVMLNLLSLGAQVKALGRVGDDFFAGSLRETLRKEGVDICGLITDCAYPTPQKNRIMAGGQQIVRVDHESIVSLSQEAEKEVLELIPGLLSAVDIVAISDYAKGFLSCKVLSKLIFEANKRAIPVIVDPKGCDFTKYNGADLIKPNQTEAYQAANVELDAPLERVAEAIHSQVNIKELMITRSEAGITLFDQQIRRRDHLVDVHEIRDVTGAGDTVLATITLAIANGLSFCEAARLANVAAGIAIERFGCARVSLGDIAKRLLQLDAGNKVFEEEHLFVLRNAIDTEPFVVCGLNSFDGLSSFVYQSLRQLKQKYSYVLIYIRDDDPDREFVEIMSSLCEVDFIILKQESLEHFLSLLVPKEAYILEAGRLDVLKEASVLCEI